MGANSNVRSEAKIISGVAFDCDSVIKGTRTALFAALLGGINEEMAKG